jgi:hypothetical protein
MCSGYALVIWISWCSLFYRIEHGLRTLREEIAFTARPKIQSKSQIVFNGRNIFCLPHRHNFSDIFDLCLYWVSVVRGIELWASKFAGANLWVRAPAAPVLTHSLLILIKSQSTVSYSVDSKNLATLWLWYILAMQKQVLK